MAKLMLRPTQADYSVSDPEEYIATETRGGLPKTRRDLIGASRIIDVSWILNATQFQYLIDFDAANLARNSEPFEVDLCIDSLEYKEYTVTIVPQSLVLNRQTGDAYMVNIKFECDTQDLVDGEDPLAVEADDGDEGNGGVGEGGPAGGGAGYFPPSVATLAPFLRDEFNVDGLMEEREPDVGYYEGGWADVNGDSSTVSGLLVFTGDPYESPYAVSVRYGPETPDALVPVTEWLAEWTFVAPETLTGSPLYVAVISESVLVEALLALGGESELILTVYISVDGVAEPYIVEAPLLLDWVAGREYYATFVHQRNSQVLQIQDGYGGIQALSLAADLSELSFSEQYVSTVLLQAEGLAAAFGRVQLSGVEPSYGFLDRFDGTETLALHVADISPTGWRWRTTAGALTLGGGEIRATADGSRMLGQASSYISAATDYVVRFVYETPDIFGDAGTVFELDLRGAWGQTLETVKLTYLGEGVHTVQLGNGAPVEVSLSIGASYTGQLRVTPELETNLEFGGELLDGALQSADSPGSQWPYAFAVTLGAQSAISELALIEIARGGTPPAGDYCTLGNGTDYDDSEYGVELLDNFVGSDGDITSRTAEVGTWAVVDCAILDDSMTVPASGSAVIQSSSISSTFYDEPWRLDFRVARFNVAAHGAVGIYLPAGDQLHMSVDFPANTNPSVSFNWRFEDGPTEVIGPIEVAKPFCQWIEVSLLFTFGAVGLSVDGVSVGSCPYAGGFGSGYAELAIGGTAGYVLTTGEIRVDGVSIRALPPI